MVTRKQLVTHIIPRLYEACLNDLRSQFGGQQVTMSLDGWTSPDNRSLIGIALNNRLIDPQAMSVRHTSDNLASLLTMVLQTVEADMGCSVVSVVSDAASNMVGMRSKVMEVRTDVAHFNCQAHQMNLCLSDYFKDQNRSKVC